MKEYLSKNWKHIAAAIAAGVLQVLSATNVITPVIANSISVGLVALGLSTTSNSGTQDATKTN